MRWTIKNRVGLPDYYEGYHFVIRDEQNLYDREGREGYSTPFASVSHSARPLPSLPIAPPSGASSKFRAVLSNISMLIDRGCRGRLLGSFPLCRRGRKSVLRASQNLR